MLGNFEISHPSVWSQVKAHARETDWTYSELWDWFRLFSLYYYSSTITYIIIYPHLYLVFNWILKNTTWKESQILDFWCFQQLNKQHIIVCWVENSHHKDNGLLYFRNSSNWPYQKWVMKWDLNVVNLGVRIFIWKRPLWSTSPAMRM